MIDESNINIHLPLSVKIINSNFTKRITVEEVTPTEVVIEMFESLDDPDTHIFNTVKDIYKDLRKAIYEIPLDSLNSFVQLFLSVDLNDDSEDDENSENEEEEEEIEAENEINDKSSTTLEYLIKIIYILVRSKDEGENEYLEFFLNPDIVLKVFQFYDVIRKAPDLINTFAEKSDDFIEDYRENILSILNTSPLTDSKAELISIALKMDDLFIPADDLFDIIDPVLKSQSDPNLYQMALTILRLLVNKMPNEIIPKVLPELSSYIIQDGDSNDRQFILEFYIDLLKIIESFDGIVDDAFINLLHEVIEKETDDDTLKLPFTILLFDYDLKPFLEYLDFFESFLEIFDDMAFYMQRSIFVCISRIMTISTKSVVQKFANSNIVDNISYFLSIDNDELLVLSSFSMIKTISSINPDFEWSDEIIDAVETCLLSSNKDIARAAKEIDLQINNFDP